MKTVLTLEELDAITANSETKLRDTYEHFQTRGISTLPTWVSTLETYHKEMVKLRDTLAARKQATK